MNPQTAISLLEELVRGYDSLARDSTGAHALWFKCKKVIGMIYGPGSEELHALDSIDFKFRGVSALGDDTPHRAAYARACESAKQVLREMIRHIENFGIPAVAIDTKPPAIQIVESLCVRFHAVVRQLRDRYNNRPTLSVADEYDVQDLLRALLQLHFQDVRAEEWTPSYAGGSARMDFLIKDEQLVIETKKTREGLDGRKIGEQLIIDIAKYCGHSDCKTLFCFVYDPDGHVSNPVGLENDLSRQSDDLVVKVVVAPKH